MQQIRRFRNCPCCGCETVGIIATPQQAPITGFPVNLDYDVVFCVECDFCYADTGATSIDYAKYYTLFSKYAPTVTHQSIFSRLASKVAYNCPDKESVIADFGCGDGGLLLELKAQGFHHLAGYDANPDCVAFIQSHGMKASCYQLGDPLPPDDMFDVVVLSAVLEHLIEPVQALSVLRDHLKEDGLIFIEVPDASNFFRYVDTLCYEFNIEHINYFSQNTLSNVMKMSGFEVLDPPPARVASRILSVVGKHASSRDRALTRDKAISRLLKRYAAYSDVFCDGLIVKILEMIDNHQEVCFWGAGVLLSVILGANKIDVSKVKCVIDSNPFYHNLSISSIPIVSPNDFFSTPCWAKLPIIISSIRSEGAIRGMIRVADKDRKIYSLI